ncbi:MAG: ATPase [Coriobacteriia bacterium]|nr:ATPase [Coriobacteriia bacterium]
MDIIQLVDRIEEVVDTAKGLPMTQNKIVNPDDIYEIVDEIRHQFPEDLKQARWIVKQRQEMVEEAEREANRILEDAQERARAMVDEQEVVRQADARAQEIMDDARAAEREVRLGADDYADEVMANLEVNLGKMLTAVQRGRDRLQAGKTTR